MRSAALAASIFTLLIATPVAARQKAPEWDVTREHGPGKDIEFSTDEGTWMSLDVSPDGRQIVFDLLGDIYLIPMEGGAARLIRGGSAYETQPRFSPDGARIAFTSDRDGLENLLKAMHKGTRHVGKTPRRIVSEGQIRGSLGQLREDLATAVQEERYEDAARLKDQISQLQQKLVSQP